MKHYDFARFRAELLNNGSVTFSSREELIEFFSQLMANRYWDYAVGLTGISAEESYSRTYSDPVLVEKRVKAYLNDNMPKTPKTILDIARGWFSKPKDVVISMGFNNIYKQVVENLGRGDSPDDIFEDRVEYTIIGETLLKRKTF